MVRHLTRLAALLLLLSLLLSLGLAQPAIAAYTGPVIFNTGACLTGGPVPPTPRTVEGMFPVNLQTGTSYAIVTSDKCKFIKFSNAAALAITLPGTVLPSGWMAFVEDRGAGGGTITPGAGQIEGGSTYSLAQNSPAIIFSDGSNYHVFSFTAGAGATTITINGVTCTLGSSCTIPTGAPTTCSNTGDYACLNIDEVWAARQQVPCVTLTDGATISVNGADRNAFCVTITGANHTLAAPSSLQAGEYLFIIKQDSSGHAGFATAGGYKYPGGTAPSWSSGANKKDKLTCYYDGSDLTCEGAVDYH